jgi:hypothetical protein
MAIIASRHGITLEDIVKGNFTKLTERRRKKLAKLQKSKSFAENRVNEDLKGYKKAFKIRDKYLNRR